MTHVAPDGMVGGSRKEGRMNAVKLTGGGGYYRGMYRNIEFEIMDYEYEGPRGGIRREWSYKLINAAGWHGGSPGDPVPTRAHAIRWAKAAIDARLAGE